MSGSPVVISENGFGMAVRAVEKNAPVLTISENGFGVPIVISDLGTPFVVEGLNPFNPAYFGPGIAGDLWWPTRDWAYTKTLGGVYEKVTTTGDLVARVTGSNNGINADQDTEAARPVYTEGSGLSWLVFDTADDLLSAPVDTVGVFDYFTSYVPAARNFVLQSRVPGSTGGYVGIGQSGSGSTVLNDAVGTQNAIYFDNVISAATTRGGQYTSAQAARSAVVNYNTINASAVYKVCSIGNYPGGFYTPGNVYAWGARQGTLTADQRAGLTTWLRERTPA